MKKEKRIIDIKSVQDFYKALRNEVANLFNDYERYGFFDGWTEQQKQECFGFGTHVLSIVYNPIQKRYTKQERKKYDKIIDNYEEICKRKDRQISNLQSQLAEKENDELQDKLHSYYEQIMNKGTCGLCEYVRTDYKISFAIEQLEKLKYTINVNQTDNGYTDEQVDLYELNEIIDQQINELKGNVKDERN